MTSSVTRDDLETSFYFDKLSELSSYLADKSTITADDYKIILSLMPSDLAARLRFVPDQSLSSRLAHLLEIFDVVSSMTAIGKYVEYSIVSIENSCSAIPVDCDLVILDDKTDKLVFIDFTASRNHNIINKKNNILMQNIELNQYKDADYLVYQFNPRNFHIDITPTFSSSEPGTVGLRFMDDVSSMDERYRNEYINNCKEVYRRTTLELAHMDNSCPPGDYKETEIPDELLLLSKNLVVKQSDSDSIKYLMSCNKKNPEYFPYFEGLRELLKKAQTFKPLFMLDGALPNENRDLVAKLASLSDNWLVKGIHAACLTDDVVTVDEADKLAIYKEFPLCESNGIIAEPSKFKVAIQRKKGHVFTIKFSKSHMDSKLKRILTSNGEKKDKRKFKFDTVPTDEDVTDYIEEAKSKYTSDAAYFQSMSLNLPTDDIWKKILTISALSSNDMDNFGRSTTSFLDALISAIRQSYAGSSMSHYYEVCKSVLASLKTSPSDNTYYVGTNGSYDSVTIVKMSSTLDSFKRCCFSVIYKHERIPNPEHTRLKSQQQGNTSMTGFYSMDPNQLSYGIRLPFIWVSLASWEIENNMDSGAIANGVISQVLIDSAFTVLINRDQFAQSAEQVRYFYMSAIGYGGSAADIVDKTTFMRVRHHWEILYLLRAFKMSAALCCLSTRGMLSDIENKDTKELSVAFPHTSFPSKSFSQTISSMYICNIYNKFRSFHEVSEAICFNEILDERDIYLNRVKEDYNAVAGLSPFFFSIYKMSKNSAVEYIMHKNMIEKEVEFATSLAILKSNRYSGSSAYIIGATAVHMSIPDSTFELIYSRLNKAPIEACTMRGSMDEGTSTGDHQGIRAASAVLESMVKKVGHDPKRVNKNILGSTYMMDTIKKNRPTFSIISSVMDQFNDGSIVYRYRIVQKDQKGHREISVLNFNFRIGALFVETITRELSQQIGDTEIANNPNKDKIIEDLLSDSFKKEKGKRGTHCYDNSDQKRWGPNHNMNFFAYCLLPLLSKEPGLMRLANRVLDLTFDKRAKFPESLIDLITKKNMNFSNSLQIDKFIKYAIPKVGHMIFEARIFQGMCQGIYQQTSSMVHAIKTRAHAAVVTEIYPTVTLKFLATSDDAECVEFIPFGLNRVEVVKFTHSAGLRVGNLFNIVRSNPKSAFNFHIAELNSIFFKRGTMATPSLKQRIAKVDVGMGVNHMEDYLSAMASASNYLASGGSYMGSVILTVLNFVLHTEQWLRWEFVKSDNYYKPVELGGFPVIEPITTILSGGVANFYQRISNSMGADEYAKLTVNSLLCPPEELSLADFSRTGSERVKKSFQARDLTIFKGTGPLGIFQMVKTDRKLSQFERRHGISQWLIPDEFATIRRDSPRAGDFMFSIFRGTSVSTLETNLGVNSFFVRMAEPWASYTRPCLRMSEHSPFKSIMGVTTEVMSHKDFSDVLKNLTYSEASFKMNQAARIIPHKPEFEIMEAQLSVRFRDAKSIMTFLSSQEAETFKKVSISPTIQRVTLRGHTASDSDSYLLAMIKTMAGKKSAPLINEYKRLATAYTSIDVPEPKDPMPLVDAVVLADNAISLYEKFIRKDTKMILPNRVDDLRELCHDIISNKFAERLGMVLDGSVKLDVERSKPYAHSKWFQDLIKISSSFETSVANSVINGGHIPSSVVGITSARAVITRGDIFEITSSAAPTRTILVDAKSKDAFVNTIRTWCSAKVKLVLSRETINSFLNGRLTFAHDYYIGHDTFFRYAKTKYLNFNSGSSKGLHTIMTTVKTEGHRRVTSYRHIIYFDSDITGRNLEITKSDFGIKEEWSSNIIEQFSNFRVNKMNHWFPIKENKANNRLNFRKTEIEKDFIIFRKLTQGTEFNITATPGSMCLMMETSDYSLPVTYLNPGSIEEFKIGYTLTHNDLKVGVKAYAKLAKITNNFEKNRFMYWAELNSALDFILVGSTTNTPEFVINKVLKKFVETDLTAIQLDILRTFMIKNPKFGVSYSSSRFTQYLLNLGNRRNHNHSFLCKTAAGDRADLDSEDWDMHSAEEDLLTTGKTDPHSFEDIDSDDENIVPLYMNPLNDVAEEADVQISQEDEAKFDSWADEVIAAAENESADGELNVQTVEIFDLFDDTDSDEEVDNGTSVKDELTSSTMVQNVQVAERSSNNSPVANIDMNAFVGMNMLDNFNFDDVFDMESDSLSAAGSSKEDKLNVASLDNLFSTAISGTYEKIKDVKDKGLKSEKSGHTVSPTIENARVVINYLKSWIENVGVGMQFDQEGILTRNVASVTGIYAMMEKMNVLDYVNPLEKFYGLDNMVLPVELSALAVIDVIYG